MGRLVSIDNPKRLTPEELFAISGKDINIIPKSKGEIFMDFVDKDTGELKKHRHIYNTRTWMWRNIVQAKLTLNSGTQVGVVISNDDGEWHARKNIMRALYASNGGNYFRANATVTVFTATYIYQYVAQFQAAPAGTVKTINSIGLTQGSQFGSVTNARGANNIIAATKLPGAGETQDEFTVLNITYKLTFTI